MTVGTGEVVLGDDDDHETRSPVGTIHGTGTSNVDVSFFYHKRERSTIQSPLRTRTSPQETRGATMSETTVS